MLKFIGLRNKVRPKCFITKEEIKFFNLAKLLLESGYVLEKDTVNCMLALSEVDSLIKDYNREVEKDRKNTDKKKRPYCPPGNGVIIL